MKRVKFFVKYLCILVALPAIFFLSAYSLEQRGFFKIDDIDISITTKDSQKNYVNPRLLELSQKLEIYKGLSLWKVSLKQISNVLQEEKWIKSFQVSRAWPSGLHVKVVADTIEILVVSDEGLNAEKNQKSDITAAAIRPITDKGTILKSIGSEETPNVIISHDTSLLKSESVRQGALSLIRSLPEEGYLNRSQISEIGYDKKEGYWVKILKSDTVVNFGTEQFEIKTARINQVVHYLDSRDLKARVIDANLSKKVLVRLRQSP